MNKLFKVTPLPCLLLLPDAPRFTIADVNHAYLNATGTKEADLLGIGIFEAFPDNAADLTANGVSNLSQSLQTVVATKKPHKMAAQKYDIPVRGSDKFELRYWNPENVPVLDDDGNIAFIMHTVTDVTEKIVLQQKQAKFEEQAVSTNELLGKMVKPTEVSSWEYNIETNELHWSDEYFRMCGYEPQSFTPTVEKAIEIIHPEDRERSGNSFRRTVETGRPYRIERRMIRQDGEVIYVLTTGVAVRNSNGEVDKVTGLSQNITSGRQMETMLRETIGRLRDRNEFIETILQNIPIGIAVNRISDGKATLMNDKFSKTYGWDEDDFKDIPSFFEKVYPEEGYRNEITKRILDDIASGDPERMDWDNVRITTKTGEKRIIKAKNFPLFDQDLMISTVQDITVQKQEEERLRLLESVIVNSSDSVLISVPNPESRFSSTIYVNKAFSRMTGYSEDEMIGKPPSILLGEKSGKEEMAMLFESISAVKPCQINIIGYKKNGEEFWSQLSTYPIVNNDGKLTHWVSISRDITQRKYLEEKQKEAIEQQALFVSIVNSSDDAIISKTLDGTITSWNKGAEKIFNYTQAEAVGNHISIILPPHLLGEEANIVERIKRNETFEHYETERIKKDGSRINVSLTVSPLKNADGAIIGASKVARDITERKRAQDAIKASNERYDLVSRATHDSIWDCNLITGTLTRTGDGMKLLFGYDNDDERCNSVEGWARLIHPDDLAQIEESYNKVFADANQYYWEAEYRFLKADGEYAYVYDKGYIIRNEKGEAIRVIGAAKNITDLKKSTAELEELNTKLIDKADQLAKSNKELEQFAFVASHDLQEPLRMVTSFLTLIENKYEHALDEKGKKYIHFAVDGAKRMRQIILDLLEFSRVGRTGEKAEYVNLNNLVEEVIVLLGEKIKESNATIEVGVLPSIYASKVSLRQVFQNLVDNALKYSQKVTHAQITISVEDLKTHWQFSIKDNGIGIDNQFFEKIFVIFQRLHGKGEFSGNGLGLAVTKKIVENMGGKIWVDSLRGQGSIFYFTIQKK